MAYTNVVDIVKRCEGFNNFLIKYTSPFTKCTPYTTSIPNHNMVCTTNIAPPYLCTTSTAQQSGICRTNGKSFTNQTSFSTQWTTEALCILIRLDRRPRCTRHYMSGILYFFLLFRNSNDQVPVEKGTKLNEIKPRFTETNRINPSQQKLPLTNLIVLYSYMYF